MMRVLIPPKVSMHRFPVGCWKCHSSDNVKNTVVERYADDGTPLPIDMGRLCERCADSLFDAVSGRAQAASR